MGFVGPTHQREDGVWSAEQGDVLLLMRRFLFAPVDTAQTFSLFSSSILRLRLCDWIGSPLASMVDERRDRLGVKYWVKQAWAIPSSTTKIQWTDPLKQNEQCTKTFISLLHIRSPIELGAVREIDGRKREYLSNHRWCQKNSSFQKRKDKSNNVLRPCWATSDDWIDCVHHSHAGVKWT